MGRRGVGDPGPSPRADGRRSRAARISESLEFLPPPGSRVAVVGGCGAFGRPLVETCLSHELEVAVLDLHASVERHRPPSGTAATLAVDATDESSVESAFGDLSDGWDGLDALVFLAGFTLVPPISVEEISPARWDDVVAGNLRSAYLTTRAALPLLRRRESAAIVAVSSGLAYAPLPGFGPYASAKAGLIALTKSLAVENAPSVRANAVAPSASLTAFMGGGTGRGGDDADLEWFDVARYTEAIPLGRMCEPSDVIGPILFLAGPAASYVTGQVLHINGGKLTP